MLASKQTLIGDLRKVDIAKVSFKIYGYCCLCRMQEEVSVCGWAGGVVEMYIENIV